MSKDQTALLEELRNRHHDAQVKLQEAQTAFQAAQAAHAITTATLQKTQQAFATAQQQFHGWNTAYNAVMAEETARKQAAQQGQLNLPETSISSQVTTPVVPEPTPTAPQKSQTDVIRDLLHQHPAGLTPAEIWNRVHDQFKYRAYMYSVLKRLTDREELRVSRGKYSFRPVPQETKEVVATIQ